MGTAIELNLEGLPGPTHTFAGLAYGNTKAMHSQGTSSRPRAAALQGLAKMYALHERGVEVAVLPPPVRPDFDALRQAGFTGSQTQQIEQAQRDAPELLRAVYSASAMWAANAATVSPAADTLDGRVHLTPANLASQQHRALEVPHTEALLRQIFPDRARFMIHPAQPANWTDEGAANHMRLAPGYGQAGLEVFVYGKNGFSSDQPQNFPARQDLEASLRTAAIHGLHPRGVLFLQQDSDVIDQGVFHNDVICASDRDLLLAHEAAFIQGPGALDQIRSHYAHRTGEELRLMACSSEALTVADAVETYLFNSQFVRDRNGQRVMLVPLHVQQHPRVGPWFAELLAAHADAIEEVVYVDLGESMRNGGGPACLRLRVELAEEDLALLHPGVRFSKTLSIALEQWIRDRYRETLSLEELADPQLAIESRDAITALHGMLKLSL